MKRWIIYLLVGTTTFFLGITPQLFCKPQEIPQRPQVIAVEPVRQTPKETPVKVKTNSPSPDIFFDYDFYEFNPRGTYYLIGRKPERFPEVDCIELAVDDAYGSVTIHMNEKGDYRSYEAISASITKKQLTFVTYPSWEEHFVYSFEGQFLRKGTLSKAGKHVAVLQGKLTKSRRGETVAEATIKFRIEYLGC